MVKGCSDLRRGVEGRAFPRPGTTARGAGNLLRTHTARFCGAGEVQQRRCRCGSRSCVESSLGGFGWRTSLACVRRTLTTGKGTEAQHGLVAAAFEGRGYGAFRHSRAPSPQLLFKESCSLCLSANAGGSTRSLVGSREGWGT